MAEQPQTQRELERSVIETFAAPTTPKVIATLATRSMVDLGQNARILATQYQAIAQASSMGLVQSAPGEMVPVLQTDQWHAGTPSHQFNTLSNYVSIIGQRMR